MRRTLSAVTLAVAAASTGLAGISASASAAAVNSHHLIPHVHAGTPTSANEQSENWSGYIRSGSSGSFTSSTASWTVPTLKTTYNGYSSTWVGIDGASSNDEYLIQTGTEADVVGGRATYDAWWEVITPTDEAPETLYSDITVKPGDAITASVTKTSSKKWKLALTDVTTGVAVSHSATFAGPGESAEWIQEDTDVNGSISAAPDWQSVTFHNLLVNGANADVSAGSPVDIYDSNGTQEDHTSAPNSTNDGFGVTWLATGTPTPTD